MTPAAVGQLLGGDGDHTLLGQRGQHPQVDRQPGDRGLRHDPVAAAHVGTSTGSAASSAPPGRSPPSPAARRPRTARPEPPRPASQRAGRSRRDSCSVRPVHTRCRARRRAVVSAHMYRNTVATCECVHKIDGCADGTNSTGRVVHTPGSRRWWGCTRAVDGASWRSSRRVPGRGRGRARGPAAAVSRRADRTGRTGRTGRDREDRRRDRGRRWAPPGRQRRHRLRRRPVRPDQAARPDRDRGQRRLADRGRRGPAAPVRLAPGGAVRRRALDRRAQRQRRGAGHLPARLRVPLPADPQGRRRGWSVGPPCTPR